MQPIRNPSSSVFSLPLRYGTSPSFTTLKFPLQCIYGKLSAVAKRKANMTSLGTGQATVGVVELQLVSLPWSLPSLYRQSSPIELPVPFISRNRFCLNAPLAPRVAHLLAGVLAILPTSGVPSLQIKFPMVMICLCMLSLVRLSISDPPGDNEAMFTPVWIVWISRIVLCELTIYHQQKRLGTFRIFHLPQKLPSTLVAIFPSQECIMQISISLKFSTSRFIQP